MAIRVQYSDRQVPQIFGCSLENVMRRTQGVFTFQAQFAHAGLLAVAIMAAGGTALGQATNSRAAFLADYEPHAARLANRYSNVRLRYEMTYDQGNGNAQVMQIEAKVNPHNCQTTMTANRIVAQKTGLTQSNLPLEIGVRNADYSVRLRPGTEKNPRLLDLQFIKSDSDIQDPDLRFPYAIRMPNPRAYLDIVRDEKVRILAYRDAVWRQSSLKELTIAYELYSPILNKTLNPEVKCYFDPAAGWICVGTESIDTINVYTYENPGAQEPPCPIRAEMIVEGRALFTMVFSEFRSVPPFDDAQFRLPAFGLPEPASSAQVDRVGTRWHLWLTAAACAVLGLAFFLILLGSKISGRRSQRRDANAVPELQ
jgi:hypothetical protein